VTTSSAVEDYAKAIYALEQRHEGPVGTNELAERLSVTAASASGMVKKLDELGSSATCHTAACT
jgi:DtxR family Mn-dependent transcriptional regulator